MRQLCLKKETSEGLARKREEQKPSRLSVMDKKRRYKEVVASTLERGETKEVRRHDGKKERECVCV
jgi:hypothetical protein